MSEKINVSVRELVSSVMRSGSMDRPRASYARLNRGSSIHRIIQSRGGEGYTPEVSLCCDISFGELDFTLTGRADGIINSGGIYTVDEIKTVSCPLSRVSPSDYPEYTAQAECYAYMLAEQEGLERVNVRLTFAETDTLETEYYDNVRTVDELRGRVMGLLSEYYRFALIMTDGLEQFRNSAKKLKFPHRDYREGQKDIVLDVFHTVKNGGGLFVQAPTGIGKTLSVCYGAVKAVGEGAGRRIFYLTPKSTVGEAPAAAFDLMGAHGLRFRRIRLTAKEKCCFCRDAVHDCSSVHCAYSHGHYDRVNGALYDLLTNNDDITPEVIEKTAREHCVCPYELSLDAALYCHVVICDCNYLFDPRVYLRRFFEEGCDISENIALIDEAHDLVERAREMYSATLRSSVYGKLTAFIPESDFILYQPLKNLREALTSLAPLCTENQYNDGEDDCGTRLCETPFDGIAEAAKEFFFAARSWLRMNGENAAEVPFEARTLEAAVRDAAFEAKRFADLSRLGEGKYLHLAEKKGSRVRLRMICADPSGLLKIRMGRVRAAVLFSATLKPMDYFADILGGDGALKLSLPSPFDKDQLFCAVMDKVSMRYADRERTLSAVIEIIDTVVSSRFGNYLVFLPSYEMLKRTVRAYKRIDPFADIRVQTPGMGEAERRAFLGSFTDDSAVIGFAVLGGMFSESIDLAGEKLIGTVIVGTGLAGLNLESNIIADYFQNTREAGFEYAYLYPAMNKVLQAAGRVIRSEYDHGVCILIDDRYASPQYARLLTDHIRGIRLIGNTSALESALGEFWETVDEKENGNVQG